MAYSLNLYAAAAGTVQVIVPKAGQIKELVLSTGFTPAAVGDFAGTEVSLNSSSALAVNDAQNIVGRHVTYAAGAAGQSNTNRTVFLGGQRVEAGQRVYMHSAISGGTQIQNYATLCIG